MSKLEDYIVEIDGVKYVPYDKVVTNQYNEVEKQLDSAQSLIKNAFTDLQNTLKNLDD